DNAAGLAVSEKMRAQISGINQGVKNAQDGISMVQTYEGALTETDSILQRMRTLATQSANGTYQDDVDREAIQLEFDQLNDELNQIADTDFNGVIVLNGGEMADGTKADGAGNINYATAVRQAQQVGTAGGFVKAIDSANYKGTNSETVTFTASIDDDGKVTWTASDGAKSTVGYVTADTENNAQGGFTYDGAVVTVDTSKIVAGDTITINFEKKTEAEGTHPGTVGYNIDLGKTGGDKTSGAAGVSSATIALATTATKVTSQEIADAFNALNGITIADTYAKDGTTPASTTVNGVTIPTGATPSEIGKVGEGKLLIDKDKKIWYQDRGGTNYELATITVGKMANGATNAGTVTTTVNVGQATYKPASDKAIQLVEPDGKVSQSNSNTASTATLTYKDNITLQVGARTKDSVNFTFSYESKGLGDLKADMNCSARGLGTDKLSLATQEAANAAIDKIDNAINKVSMVRGTFGAIQNRLEHKIDNLNTTSENLTSAESRIRDTNMAEEMMNFTKNQILSQASQSMLAQANQLPQGVLSLLQ
ncbi:MAG: flagellin, partial [Oscillospiraceae bacterium]